MTRPEPPADEVQALRAAEERYRARLRKAAQAKGQRDTLVRDLLASGHWTHRGIAKVLGRSHGLPGKL